MSSRALILATVMLLVGCLAAERALAQATNLEAGKTPSQIFAGTCNACHKAPRGLLKTVPASSLPSFLRQHYTTSPEMAGVLASYLISNGATDTRMSGVEGGQEGSQGRDKKRKRGQAGGETAGAARSLGPQDLPRRGAGARGYSCFVGRVGGAIAVAVDDRGRRREQNAKQKLTKREKPGRGIAQGRGRKGDPGGGSPRPASPKAGKARAPSQSANAARPRPQRPRAAARSGASGDAAAGCEFGACARRAAPHIRHIDGDQCGDRSGRAIAIKAGRAAACSGGGHTGAAAVAPAGPPAPPISR